MNNFVNLVTACGDKLQEKMKGDVNYCTKHKCKVVFTAYYNYYSCQRGDVDCAKYWKTVPTLDQLFEMLEKSEDVVYFGIRYNRGAWQWTGNFQHKDVPSWSLVADTPQSVLLQLLAKANGWEVEL